MALQETQKNKLLLCLVWMLEGIVVGFGAILPGISGGTLCVAFGMYRPLVETISSPRAGLKKNGWMLAVFVAGIAVGFVGLSGVAALLLEKDAVLVTCAFVGFILGTFPDLWKDAGAQGRGKGSYLSMGICFAAMLCILVLFKTKISLTIAPDIGGFLLCGVLWALSFIVPGLSSSTLLLFFGLYQPMLEGIYRFDMRVLIPMGIGMAGCVLLLSKGMGMAYQRYYAPVSHGVLGIVAATAVMVLPYQVASLLQGVVCVLFILGGAVVSYALTCLCDKIAQKG